MILTREFNHLLLEKNNFSFNNCSCLIGRQMILSANCHLLDIRTRTILKEIRRLEIITTNQTYNSCRGQEFIIHNTILYDSNPETG